MRWRLVVTSIVIAVIFVVSLVVAVSYSENFLFRRDLSLVLVNQTVNGLPECDYIANITDSGVDTGGFIYLRVEPARFSNQHPVYLEIQNPESVELDTISLTFDSSQITSVYFQGHYDVEYTYSFVRNGYNVATIKANESSGAASGGSAYYFLLYTHDVDGKFNMRLTVELSMHYNAPLQLTEVHAVAPVDVSLYQDPKL